MRQGGRDLEKYCDFSENDLYKLFPFLKVDVSSASIKSALTLNLLGFNESIGFADVHG